MRRIWQTMRATDEDLRAMESIVKRQEICLENGETDEVVRLNTDFHDMIYACAKSKKLWPSLTTCVILFSATGFLFCVMRAWQPSRYRITRI